MLKLTSFMQQQDIGLSIENSADDAIKEANKLLETVEGYIPKIVEFGIKVLIAILIFAAGKIIISFILKFLKKFFEKTKVEISIRKFLLSLIKVLLYVLLVIIVCNHVGVDTTSFVAILGSAGLAVGLAMQGSLSNFAGGILILLVRPFVVGDYIIDEGTGKEGTVIKIDLFYTQLATSDNKTVIIPNGNLTNSAITNTTAQNKRRVDIEVGISYNADMAQAKDVVAQVISCEDRILKDEEIAVFIKELAPSQVTVGLRVWANTVDYWSVYYSLTENIKLAFDKAGIEIPFNQLEVHVKSDER